MRIKTRKGSSLNRMAPTLPDEEQLVANGFIHEELYIDPASIAHELAKNYPDQFRLGWLARRFAAAEPPTSPTPRALAILLRAADSDPAPSPARRIWEKLSPADRQIVLSLANGDEAAGLPDRLADCSTIYCRTEI